jgi:hypothetical protein
MTTEELEALRRDIADLRRAVRKANPFLRAVVQLRSYAILSIPLGILVLVFCLVSHFLVQSYASLAAVPAAWKTAFWIAVTIMLVGGSALKWIVLSRRAAQIEKGATFVTAVKAMYGGGGWMNLNLPITLCMVVVSVYTSLAGHPWLIMSTVAIFLGLICNSFALALERGEYLVTGWYALLSGLASLFFVEAAPFIWTAIVWAGIFFVYAASGLYYLPREERP